MLTFITCLILLGEPAAFPSEAPATAAFPVAPPALEEAAAPVSPPPAETTAQPKAAGEKGHGGEKGHSASRLSDEHIPLQIDLVPNRPRPVVELGEPFLGTGTLAPGFQLPTGAVWQPSMIVFGQLRTAFQSNGYNPAVGDARTTEAVARLDLFGNIALSGSERLVVGFHNLDEDGVFTGHVFESDLVEEGGQDALNSEVASLFFEGDIGEIFPNLSPRDFRPTDIGFSVGRQPLFFQEGMLINDTVDGIGLTWNSLQPRKTSNFRSTFFYGWNNVDRNNLNQETGNFFGLFNSIDYRRSTVEIDLAYSAGEETREALTAFGISAVQRFGLINTSFRLLGSRIENGEDGLLLFSEVSWTPHHTHNLAYINSFWVQDTYTPVALGPGNGGALGRAGINFAGVGIGNYGAPLNASADRVAGAAFGYQMFFDHTRKQVILEAAARVGNESGVDDQYGATVRYQMAMGRRFVLVVDAFANYLETFDEDTYYGGRLELQISF